MSIRTRLVLGLSVIFGSMLVVMNFFIAGNIRSGNQTYINNDLVVLENNGQIYARQVLIIHALENNEESFAEVASEITQELSGVTGNPVAAYSCAGVLLHSTADAVFETALYDDLTLATQNRAAFTLDTSAEGRTVAYFSYPVVVEGNTVGIIRTVADYTALYTQGSRTMQFVTAITVSVFGAALAATLVFAQNITRPIARLASLSDSVARHVQDGTLDPNRVRRHLRAPRKDEIGKLSRNYLNMIVTVSDQMHTIEADKEAMRRLADYRKELYDSVTHELKTPLTSIRGYAEVLEENGFTDEEFFKKGIQHIKEESDRMHAMVVQLLESSRLSTDVDMPKEPVETVALVMEVCQAMQFKAEKYNHTLQLVTGEQTAYIMANADKLREVFINLVDNAIKYAVPGKTITVGVERLDTKVCFYVVNYVAAPLPEEDLTRVFDPFYRRQDAADTLREEGSSGLGLSICRQITEKHGGTVAMKNLPKNRLVVNAAFPACDKGGATP